MSMVEHCINGYGFEFDCRDGKNTTVNKIEKMLSETTKLKKITNGLMIWIFQMKKKP